MSFAMVQRNLTRTPYRPDRSDRIGEFVVASVLLALTLPLIAIVAIAIKCESPGPILVRQRRISARGEHFTAVKFRTTVYKFQQRSRNRHRGENPQLTRLGWLLRYSRIENLPQLINVLRGEMSCMNPRFGYPFFLD